MEKRLGVADIEPIIGVKPPTVTAATLAGAKAGAYQVGQTVAGAMSLLPGDIGRDAESRRLLYKERADAHHNYALSGPGQNRFTKRLPLLSENAVSFIPEATNVFSGATKLQRAANIAYHGLRGWAQEKSLRDAAISATGHVVGEKTEDIITHGGGVAGNIAGFSFENLAQWALGQSQQ